MSEQEKFHVKPDEDNGIAEIDARMELRESHALMDALCVLDDDTPLADRLRELIVWGVGERARGCLRTEMGVALARHHLETCGHKPTCTCVLCRDSKGLLGILGS